MLAYLLLACFVLPLLLLVADVMVPRKHRPAPPAGPAAPRPRATTAEPRRRGATHTSGETQRPPRIAPGDGMVYRGSVGPRSR